MTVRLANVLQKDEEKRPHQPGSNLVFLSARPESYEVG